MFINKNIARINIQIMSDFNSAINCPDCGTTILINTKQLLLGHKYSCHNCNISIGLSQDSREIVEDTIKKLVNFHVKSNK